ncbi:MAG: diacylglycerol kinase family protein [Myxococcota bacterium]|nr:diacylglycerol kinase family protein [Myxococcota bacterium]
MRIGLLNNLRAGRSSERVSRLLQFLKGHPDVVSVETDSALAVPEALSELARQEVELLAINGGDGTVQHALTEILGQRAFEDRVPMIAPLRGGRTNMTALDLGAHRDPRRGLANLIAASREGTIQERLVERQVLRVEYGATRKRLYGMFFGGGMIYKAIELNHRIFKKDARSQGVVGATLVTAGLVVRAALGQNDGILEPNKVQVLLDGEPVARSEFLMVISTSLQRLFAGMRPFWGRGPGGVRFTAFASDAENFKGAVPGILRGKPRAFVTEESGYLSRNVKCAEMRFDCGFTVDGELVMPDPGCIASLTADEAVSFVRA